MVGHLPDVLAPPYDVVSPATHAALAARSRYNIIHLSLGADEPPDPGETDPPAVPADPTGRANRYRHAARRFAGWLRDGALTLDPDPALYVYEQRFVLDGEERVQRGVLASVRLDDTRTKVLPHEATIPAGVEDRRQLLAATGSNLSPIFVVYQGAGAAAGIMHAALDHPPRVAFTDEYEIAHWLWRLTDRATIGAFTELLGGQSVLIADGHHRYAAALRHRSAMRAATGSRPGGWDHILMMLVDADSVGPTVRPFHRLLHDVPVEALLAAAEGEFTEVPLAGPAELDAALTAIDPGTTAFGVYGDGRSLLLVGRDETGTRPNPALDVDVLHEELLERRLGIPRTSWAVTYEPAMARALAWVDAGAARTAVLVRRIPFAAIFRLAAAGHRFPPKSTFFYPKPLDGLVLRPLDPSTVPIGPVAVAPG